MNYNDIQDKKIFVIVPHQDDEINVAGGFIEKNSKQNEISVVYVTNGDFILNADVRYKEAIEACKVLGVEEKNVYFLGYPDTPYDYDTHMYTANGDFISKSGRTHTYGSRYKDEYCFIKHGIHKTYNVNNLIDDLYEIILENKPDIIIANDLDFHPDHIMTSLCVEKALGKIFNAKHDYHPMVFKNFAYENSYLGPVDFNQRKNVKMQYNLDGDVLTSNPYYKMSDAIDIAIEKRSYTKNLLHNVIWKAIKKHKSQVLVGHAFSIINANNYFWERNTNNLMYDAVVTTTSGDASLLHDFVLCDSSFILNGNKKNITYDEGIWIPDKDDRERKINISFKNNHYIKSIKLFVGNNDNKCFDNINIDIDGEKKKIELKDLVNQIEIDKNVKNIIITVPNGKFENGFSEIELIGENNKNINTDYNISDSGCTIQFIFNLVFLKLSILSTKVFNHLRIKRNKGG